jgi:uncharacterized protein YoxC
MLFTLLLSCIVLGANASIARRLGTVEIRLDTLEMRTLIDKAQIRKLEETVETLNSSMVMLGENVCFTSNQNRKNKEVVSQSANIDEGTLAESFISGFKNEKRWLRNEVQKFENRMDNMDRLLKSKVDQLENKLLGIISSGELKQNHLSMITTNETIKEALNELRNDFRSDLDKVKLDLFAILENTTKKMYTTIHENEKTIRELTTVLENVENKTNLLFFQINETDNRLKNFTKDLGDPTIPLRKTTKCEDGWTSFHSFCYYKVLKRGTFSEAKATCSVLNASVADPESTSENSFVYSVGKDHLWIGITDDGNDGIWKSARTGKIIPYQYVLSVL